MFDGQLAHVGAAARAAWRADEQAWTATALAHWHHGRVLADLAREHLHRGDVIAVTWPDAPTTFTGTVIGVGIDSFALDSATTRVDLRLGSTSPLVWRVVQRAPEGGTRGHAVDSFRARLLELEATGAIVDVGVGTGALTVGRDHVVLERADVDTTTVVAFSAIRYVRLLQSR